MRTPARNRHAFGAIWSNCPIWWGVIMTKRALSAIGVSVAIACALCVSDAQAQWFATPSGPGAWYFGPEGGWTGLQGTKTSITGTNPITGQTFNVPINQSFNSGWNVGARAGYQLGPWRFEGEYTHRQNSGDVTGPLGRLKGTFDTNSFMANGIYDFSLGWPITPHIGFGIGGVWADGTVNTTNFGSFSKSSDTLFAYQAIAGFRYMFTPSLALDLDYRYRGSSDATWHTRAFTLNGVNFPSKTFSGSTNTNNVVASLTWLFAPPPPPPPPPQPVAYPPPPPPPPAVPRVRG
jgi:OmpA-OmpF porin, OOP family